MSLFRENAYVRAKVEAFLKAKSLGHSLGLFVPIGRGMRQATCWDCKADIVVCHVNGAQSGGKWWTDFRGNPRYRKPTFTQGPFRINPMEPCEAKP